MKTPEEILSDADIERVHANANFGATSKRDVVESGLISYAFGFTTGNTMLQILAEHNLVRISKGYNATLTKRGFEYLRAMFQPERPGESVVNMMLALSNAMRQRKVTRELLSRLPPIEISELRASLDWEAIRRARPT